MKYKRQHAHSHVLAALTLLLALVLVVPGMTPAVAAGGGPPVREVTQVDQPDVGTATPAGLTADEQATIRDLIRQAQYQFTWQVRDGVVWAYRAPNRAHDLSLSLAADGFHAARYSAAGEPLWDFGLSLAAYGGQTFPAAIAADGLAGSRERVEYHWSRDVVEWYTNSAAGVEHGLTLAAPSAGAGGSRVELTFALRGSLTPELDAGGRTLRLKDASGQTALLYDQLVVYDAAGKTLPVHMRLAKGQQSANLHLIIDAADAAYPLTVDPLLHGLASKLTASDAEDEDQFGYSVAISGDTVVVGAYQEDGGLGGTDSGAAYVFERNQDGADSWGEVRKLDIIDPTYGSQFGYSVAISGDTIVVGAPLKDYVVGGTCLAVGHLDCGAAYIFTRNQSGADHWAMVTKIYASDAAAGDKFGSSVAISGDTLVVGAPYVDGGGTDRGAAYLFERNWGGADQWGQRKILTASSAANYAWFGSSVGISGDTVVVGAWGENTGRGAAYLFTRNQGGAENSWGQETRLFAPDAAEGDCFGSSVAISGDTVVVGAWGTEADGADTDRGAAYLFERNYDPDNPSTPLADNWGQAKMLFASDAADHDNFGESVAISGDTVVVGARGANSGGTDRGAAYLFARNQGGGDSWGQVTKLTASDAEDGDSFGNSVAVSGDTVVAGAPWEDGASSNGNRGAAYLFVPGHGQWQQVAIPRASDAEDGDRFGYSVAVSGDTAVVGADREDGAEGDDRGAVYIIERNVDGADKWGEVKKLTASDDADDDYFGRSVAISGDTVVVGAWAKDNDSGIGPTYYDQGAAYVFTRNQDAADAWGEVAILRLDSSDQDNVYFGYSVAISGDTIIVGARGQDMPPSADVGAAYIFERNKDGTDKWGQVQELLASDGASGDDFGCSVAISGDTAVVGAYGEDGGGGLGSDRGAAYVFERNEGGRDGWGEVQKLTASDTADDDQFGYSVAISGDTAVVGAYLADDRGAAYIFERNYDPGNPDTPLADNWGQVKRLRASDAADDDNFGVSVAISGDTAVVGAHLEDGLGIRVSPHDRGAAYVFERNHDPDNPSTPLADNWGQVTRLRASDAANDDYFGISVAISSNQIVVGAYGVDGGGTDRGAAYVYRLEPLPDIKVWPGSLTFGDWGVGAGPTPSQAVTIANESYVDLHISSVSLTGANPAQFAIDSDSGEDTLAPGGTRTVQVSFDPSSTGAKSANLSIDSDDDDEPTVNVTLSGNGVPASSDTWHVYLPMVLNNH